MSSDILIDFKNVSKKYCRSLKRSLWYGVQDITKEVTGRSKDDFSLRKGEFWALDNVSFQLKRGESIGLIGHNGAGKTTVLKLINNLIKPTNGSITVNGTIGALIALGTGFNPLLTGRENIRIAAAVLGYTKKEVNKKFDEIIEFSEIGQFVDAPVRSYSSGMLVRLGFSVAIHTKPDILLIDEILAVGDLGFAIKCHKKINEYKQQGGTFILVSHGLHNVRFHCQKTIWINHGKIQLSGESHTVCDEYELYMSNHSTVTGACIVIDDSIKITDIYYPPTTDNNSEFVFEFVVESKRDIDKLILVLAIIDVNGQQVISNYSNIDKFYPKIKKGKTNISIKYDKLMLASGKYTISLVISEGDICNHLLFYQNYFKFTVKNKEPNFSVLNIHPLWQYSVVC
jgi:lipopolysaccharide transport system ATP-binding protein